MNETFNGKRFVAYAIKHYDENSKAYMWMLLALFVALFGFRWVLTMSKESPANIFNYSMVVGGFFMLQIIERSTRGFTKRMEQTVNFTLPVSELEKYLFAWLNSITLFFTAFILEFWLVKIVFPWVTGLPAHPFKSISTELVIPNLLFVVFFVHAILLFSNACFKYPRAGYVITFLSFYALMMLMNLPRILGWCSYEYPSMDMQQTMEQGGITLKYSFTWVRDNMYTFMNISWMYIFAITLWTSGYFKLKERQIK